MEENISSCTMVSKYLITILCTMLVLVSANATINVIAEYDEISDIKNELMDYGIVNADILERETVSREQCLSSIMRLIGLNDEYAHRYSNFDFEYKIFSDVNGYNNTETGYILIAGFSNIAYGVYHPQFNKVDFCAKSGTTLKECIAFMVRCMDENISDINETYIYAIKNGFIKESDDFWGKDDTYITPNDLCVLLHRMLYGNRGKYYEKEEIEYDFEGEKGCIQDIMFITIMRRS